MKFNIKFYSLIFFWLILTVAFSACSPRQMVVGEFLAMVQTGLPVIEGEDDLNLLAQSLPAHIKLLETALASDPDNQELLVVLARLYGGYAFAILETQVEALRLGQIPPIAVGYPEDQLETATARYFQRGAAYALKAMAIDHPEVRQQLEQPQSSAVFFDTLGSADTPALFWYGFNLGGLVQHRLNSVAVMAKAHLVEKALNRVVALDPAYYHGGAHLALMVYYGFRSPMMGGRPEKAFQHYKQHKSMFPAAVPLRDLYLARYLLVQEQAKDEFVQRLSAIENRGRENSSERLLNKVAAVRARLYLEAIDQFFN